MDTSLLKNFLVLAKTKSFTKAAEKLYRSQSAVSLQIARLEALIGKPLFIRDKRNVALTIEGEELVVYAERIIALEQEMTHHFQQPLLTGEVTFGTPEDLATAYLPNILASFVETHPGILLHVHCEFTIPLLNGFDSQNYDLVLVKQDPKNPHPRSRAVSKEALVWVASSPRIERVLPLILAPSPCVYRQRAIDALQQHGIAWRIVYSSPSLTGTLAAVKAGLGISVLPRNMVPKELYIIRDLPALQDAEIGLLQKENGSKAVEALASYVLEHMFKRE